MTHSENGHITETELIRQLGELPRRVEPRNDPWSRIQSRISGEVPARSAPGGSTWFRIAAAVALAFALGIFLGKSWQWSGPDSGATTLVAAVEDSRQGVTPSLGALAGAERVYQAAFGEFTTLGHSAPLLKPATLEAIERDWQEMLDAEAALSAALEEYPNNAWLNKRMLELRDRQLAMLKQLAGLDRTSRRTET